MAHVKLLLCRAACDASFIVVSCLILPSQAGSYGDCWGNGITWHKCCAPSLGPRGNVACWSRSLSYDYCCWASPELEPMENDLDSCRNDPALRIQYRPFAHLSVGLREDCVSLLGCQASPSGWMMVFESEPECSDPTKPRAALIGPEIGKHACQSIEPIPPESWYNSEAYNRIHLRYRFGSVKRKHCAVPNWRLIQEEPLRLYSLLNGRSKLSRILVNIGAGDGGIDDPLSAILGAFAGIGLAWRGLYFEAVPENCKAVSRKLRSAGDIGLRCGYVTPENVVTALRDEFGVNESALCHEGDAACAGRVQERIEIDALSIDIDSYDCAVLREALLVVNPKFLIVETAPIPPPVIISAEFHPAFQDSEKKNVSGTNAIGGGTARGKGFWSGCTISAAVSLLWPFGFGLYRLSGRDSMFVRKDAADEIELGETEHGWQPADEFECWRQVCANAGRKDNFMQLTADGVHSHLMPRIWEFVQQANPLHPVTVSVAVPPALRELPLVPRGIDIRLHET